MNNNLIFGLDGATFRVLSKLMEKGIMPYMNNFKKDGAVSILDATFPPITVPGWLCIATGSDPGTLGIFDFGEYAPYPELNKPAIHNVEKKKIWDYFSRLGYRSAVINFPYYTTFRINGVYIGGLLVTNEHYTYPEQFKEEIKNIVKDYQTEVDLKNASVNDILNRCIYTIKQKVDLTKYIIKKYDPKFLFVIFSEVDRIEHKLWPYIDPLYKLPKMGIENIDHDLLNKFWNTIDSSMMEIEKSYIGNTDGNVFIVSDHGAGPIYRTFYINEWLLKNGYLYMKNNAQSKGSTRIPLIQKIYAIVRKHPFLDKHLTITKSKWLFDLIMKFTKNVGFEKKFEDVKEYIDWEKTIAYEFPIYGAIFLNKKNKRIMDDISYKKEIINKLRKELENMNEIKLKTYIPEELYIGKNLDLSPDLFIVGDDFEAMISSGFSDGKIILDYPPKMLTGTHRMDGIFLAKGTSIIKNYHDFKIRMIDIAPTILSLNGIVFDKMDGLPVRDIFYNKSKDIN